MTGQYQHRHLRFVREICVYRLSIVMHSAASRATNAPAALLVSGLA
jgi:hypothetical protein